MNSRRQSVCLITAGLVESNLRLQPWRYLHEAALQLSLQGHQVTVISNGCSRGQIREVVNGVCVHRIPTVSNPWWRANEPLRRAIQQVAPDVILWHVGLTSLLHQHLEGDNKTPVVGIFTSPLYSFRELYRIGPRKVVKGYRLSAIHLAGTLIPKWLLREFVSQNCQLKHLVVQTETTCRQLRKSMVWSRDVNVIRPGVDEAWRAFPSGDAGEMRTRLDYAPTDTVILYFGSPAPLRGLHTLIKAFELARRDVPSLKLLVLSRRRRDELLREDAELARLLSCNELGQHVKVISGYLDQETLVKHVAASDVVALPFELVPSDAPLSLLEAQALGKPIVTTDVACLAELVSHGDAYLAQPADPYSLARALQQASEDRGLPGACIRMTSKRSATRPRIRIWQQMGEEWSQLIQNL